MDRTRLTLRVAFRVDASVRMGSGHMVRCLTLAEELERRGARALFVCREHPGHLIARLEESGFEVHRLPAPPQDERPEEDVSTWLGVTPAIDARETGDLLRRHPADWLVVDHYGIDAQWHAAVRATVPRLMVIDDLANRDYDADIILDQNHPGNGERYAGRVSRAFRGLFGTRFALLQPVYPELRKLLPAHDGRVNRVLVYFGAYDRARSASRVAKALALPEFNGLAIDIVAGQDQDLAAELRMLARDRAGWRIHARLPGLAGLIARADLAVGAGGTHTWERACLGLPALVAVIADNQSESVQALAQDGAVAFVGAAESVAENDWYGALRALIADHTRVAAIARRSRMLTDGHGAGRVAVAMLGSAALRMRLRAATAADELLLLDWANDPSVRAQSFERGPIGADGHNAWFQKRLTDPGCTILIGEDQYGLPLGQVRFETNPGAEEALVDISIDAAVRGEGIGSRLLSAALQDWAVRAPGVRPVAEVLSGNPASQALFRKAGFSEIAPRRQGSLAFRLGGAHEH